MFIPRRRFILLVLLLTPSIFIAGLYRYANPAREYLTRNYLSRWPVPHSPAPPLSSVIDIFDRPRTSSDAIRTVCDSTQWNSNLVFTCSNSHGGVATLRNSILNCVRYAIQAGASMTLPLFHERDAADIARVMEKGKSEAVGLETLFDVPHFVESLALSCPQLKLFNSTADIPSHKSIKAVSLQPESIGGPIGSSGLQFPEQWHGLFYLWLAKSTDVSQPVVVDLERSFMQYPIYSDPELFALDFGRILKFRMDARMLATTVLKNMVAKYEMPVDPWAPIWKNSFFGVHLRTERDAQHVWSAEQLEFSKFATQSEAYLNEVKRSGLSIIYVASGDKKEATAFSADARALNLTVIAKHDLLHGDDLMQLEAFSFDQQALVDFLVLLKAHTFVGVGHSVFAWNVALWRHVFAQERNHLRGPELMRDEFSGIYGTLEKDVEFAPCLWP